MVVWLLYRILEEHATKGITLRNVNGSQLILNAVREYLLEGKIP